MYKIKLKKCAYIFDNSAHILECLEITSAKALKEFAEVMDYLQSRSNQAREV